MRIIDQTPFYKENGELSMLDRGKAVMQFGLDWLKEVEAQKSVLPVLDKVLDQNYTLLRNVTPPGLEARIPFILVGPTGIYVMYVTPLVGLFRAKGDQWGTISGNTFKPERPNLLIRTERMARAVQVFLRRQGFAEPSTVEAVLLCSDPSFNVDSLRPIIRVVMRDALEYFAASITQARRVLSPEAAHNIVDRIVNPSAPVPQAAAKTEAPPAAAPAPVAPPSAESTVEPEKEPYVPAFALPGAEAVSPRDEMPVPESWFIDSEPESASEAESAPPTKKKSRLTRRQWIFLIGLFVIWCFIATLLTLLIIQDLL